MHSMFVGDSMYIQGSKGIFVRSAEYVRPISSIGKVFIRLKLHYYKILYRLNLWKCENVVVYFVVDGLYTN